jgi:hypothetical protein
MMMRMMMMGGERGGEQVIGKTLAIPRGWK